MAHEMSMNSVDKDSTMPHVEETVGIPLKDSDACDARATALANYMPGTKEERRLVRKVDLFMVPTTWFMCVLAFLDRSNVANAYAGGMKEDLSLAATDYSLLVSVFFIGYMVFEIPSNLVLHRLRPSVYLPGIMGAWGALLTGMSHIEGFKSMLVCRFFLGVLEAGFFPGVLYILSCWYKRDEIGKRYTIFYTALCFSGAISGLLSGAVISGLDGAKGLAGWRWLFLIEGVITIGFAICSHFILMDYPTTSKRLTPEQRILAEVRIIHDKDVATRSTRQRKQLTPWQTLKAAFIDPRTYFFTTMYMLANGSTTISYFIPTVLQSNGYQGIRAQWMSIPIWVVGATFLIVFGQTADRTGDRRWHMAGCSALTFLSAVVCVSVKSFGVRYAFICLYVAGIYLSLPLIMSWTSDVIALPAEKRAVVLAAVNCSGSISVIYGSYLWPATDAPGYITAFSAVASFQGVNVLLAILLPVIFKYLPKPITKAELELIESPVTDLPEADGGNERVGGGKGD